MPEHKLLSSWTLHSNIVVLLDERSQDRENSPAHNQLLELLVSSKDLPITTTMCLYEALDTPVKIRDLHSIYDQFLAINKVGTIQIIKPASFTKKQHKEWWKIINNIEKASDIEKIITSWKQSQHDDTKNLLECVKNIGNNPKWNYKIWEHLREHKQQLLHNNILFTDTDKRILIGSYAIHEDHRTTGIQKIVHDHYYRNIGRMIGFDTKALYSTSQFYMFSKRKLLNHIEHKLQIIDQSLHK